MFGSRPPSKPHKRSKRKRKPPWTDPETLITLTPLGWIARGRSPADRPIGVLTRVYRRLIAKFNRIAVKRRAKGGVA